MADENITIENSKNTNSCESTSNMQMDMFSDTWGFSLEDLYKIGVTFYKEKVGSKALQLTYKDKLRMVALTKQVASGPYHEDALPAVGFLDVVGNDRKVAWQSLGNMSQEDAMSEFISFLRKSCPQFAPYVQAHVAERQERERKQKECEEEERRAREDIERLRLAEATQIQQEEKQRQVIQEMMIRDALNKQTAVQFQQYAQQQFPGDTAQQEALIRQLQDQHYVQYMQQCYNQQLLQQQLSQQQQQQATESAADQLGRSPTHGERQPQPSSLAHGSGANTSQPADQKSLPNGLQKKSDAADAVNSSDLVDDDADPNELPPVAAASMWMRKDMKEFKDSLKNDHESVLKVGSGEIVTVRVPTHEDGSCLFWEFATDYYDIGFGLYFEWTVDTSNQVSVQVGESSDEEDEETGHKSVSDGASDKGENEVPTEEIVPPFRRDCHSEVYCGSHVYPGRGVYLLKFDNSYSLWRSKTLYYRVYYTR